ncbi:MAG: IS66 family transposase [Acidobacteria bacterium]|nr:IS66 family transposase [Acidobacteriota bacterium]
MAPGRTKRSRRDEPTRDTSDRQEQEIERLREENERLRTLLEEYAKRIADLERQLALKQQNSSITSKPPSSDGLAGQQRERGRRTKSRRKAGGQPGHPGRHRELVPVDRLDAIVDLAPAACRHCARRLHARHTVGDPRRHQVTELPPIAAHITEYRCHRRQCPDCGTVTLAPLPGEHANQFGPQLTALIAYLTVVCRMPRLVVQRFLEGALQIPISLGSTQNAWEETSDAVAAPVADLEGALRHEVVLNIDETGHRTNGEKRWLWTFVARTFVVYRIAASRGSDVLRTVLGETFAGILGSDRLPAYLKYVVGQRQFCWAHVTRNVLSALDLATTPAAKRFCREALALDRRLFRLWHRFRGDPRARGSPLTRAELITKVLPIEKRLFALGERYLDAANADVRNLAHAFFVHNQHFFTFVHEEGVEPTNNSAERALRTAVQWRSCRGRHERHYPEFRTMPSGRMTVMAGAALP